MAFGATERWQGLHLTLRCFASLLICNDALAAPSMLDEYEACVH